MSDHKKDLEICEAATDGYRWLAGDNPCDEYVGEQQPAIAAFIDHFKQARVMELLEAESERDELKEKLRYWVTMYYDDIGADKGKAQEVLEELLG